MAFSTIASVMPAPLSATSRGRFRQVAPYIHHFCVVMPARESAGELTGQSQTHARRADLSARDRNRFKLKPANKMYGGMASE